MPWLAGRWDLVPAVVGLSIAFLGAGFGLSCVQSVILPYPVARLGDSPFTNPPGATGITIAAQRVASLGTAVLSAPTLVLTWPTWAGHEWAPLWPARPVASGIAIGMGLFLLGLRIGSRVYERRGPELLQSLERA